MPTGPAVQRIRRSLTSGYRSSGSCAALALLTLAALLTPPAAAQVHSAAEAAEAHPDVAKAVADGNAAFSAAFEAGDVEALAGLYTEDGVLMPPGKRGRQQGREAIARFFTLPASVRVVDHQLETETLEVRGDTAIETGTWTSVTRHGDGEPGKYTGPYLLVWQRAEDGRWLIDYDMWQAPPPEREEGEEEDEN